MCWPRELTWWLASPIPQALSYLPREALRPVRVNLPPQEQTETQTRLLHESKGCTPACCHNFGSPCASVEPCGPLRWSWLEVGSHPRSGELGPLKGWPPHQSRCNTAACWGEPSHPNISSYAYRSGARQPARVDLATLPLAPILVDVELSRPLG